MCNPGTYSVAGQINCENCSKGFMCPDDKMDSQIKCLNGTYSNETKSVICKICPAGYACPNPNDTPKECKSGYYSLQGNSQCFICPSGHR